MVVTSNTITARLILSAGQLTALRGYRCLDIYFARVALILGSQIYSGIYCVNVTLYGTYISVLFKKQDISRLILGFWPDAMHGKL